MAESNPIIVMKKKNSAIISLLLRLNTPTRGKFGNLMVEPFKKGYKEGFKLWEIGREENYTVVINGGKTIFLISPNSKIKLNSLWVEKIYIMEGGYPKITLGWAGQVNDKINEGDLALVRVDVSPNSFIARLANGKYKGSFDTGRREDGSELSAYGFPVRLENEKEILGQKIEKVIDYGTEAKKIMEDSKLIALFDALSAME